MVYKKIFVYMFTYVLILNTITYTYIQTQSNIMLVTNLSTVCLSAFAFKPDFYSLPDAASQRLPNQSIAERERRVENTLYFTVCEYVSIVNASGKYPTLC